jgi:hypothetical protein
VIKSAVYTQGKRSVPIQREAQNSSPAGEGAKKPHFKSQPTTSIQAIDLSFLRGSVSDAF